MFLAKSSRAFLANVCRRAVEFLRRLRRPTGSHATILRLRHIGYLTLRHLLAILDISIKAYGPCLSSSGTSHCCLLLNHTLARLLATECSKAMDPSESKPTAGEKSKWHSHKHSHSTKHRHHEKKPEASDKSFAELIPDTYDLPSSTKVKDRSKTFAQYMPYDVPPTVGKRRQDSHNKDSKPYAKLLPSDEAPARCAKPRSGVSSQN